jgi:hypothetical protein
MLPGYPAGVAATSPPYPTPREAIPWGHPAFYLSLRSERIHPEPAGTSLGGRTEVPAMGRELGVRQ